MKRQLAFMLTALLVVGSTCIPAQAKEKINDDIIVGSVENNNYGSMLTATNQEKKYTLDFSCLDVKMKNKKLVATVDNNKIENVSVAKKFTSEKKNRLTENAIKTKSLLENELNDESTQSEIEQIIEQHHEHTSTNPVISVKEVKDINGATDKKSNKLLSISGQTEENDDARIYTSVSGSGSTAWGQTNVYMNSVTVAGLELYYKDAVSLSWDSPWKLTNDYSITLSNSHLPNTPVRCNGSSNSLAYTYKQGNVNGVYVGASLANGSSGGHDFYSNFIRTSSSASYSFSAKSGELGLSVSPTTSTDSVQSNVYFTR